MALPKNPFALPKHLTRTNEARAVKAPVKKLLTEHGWFWWMPPANQYGASGVADIHAVKQGMFMVVETKYNRNDPTPLQMGFLTSVRAERHFAFVVRETTVDAFKRFLHYLDLSLEVAARDEVPGPEIGGPMLDAINEMAASEILSAARFNRAAEKGKSHVRAVDDPKVLGAGAPVPGSADPTGDDCMDEGGRGE